MSMNMYNWCGLSVKESSWVTLNQSSVTQNVKDGVTWYPISLTVLDVLFARMEPSSPMDGLAELRRLKERISVVVRKIRFLCIILQHGSVLVLAMDEVNQAEEHQQELLHGEQFHGKHLSHLGFLGPRNVQGGVKEKFIKRIVAYFTFYLVSWNWYTISGQDICTVVFK